MIAAFSLSFGHRAQAGMRRLFAGMLLSVFAQSGSAAAELVVAQIAPMTTAAALDYAAGARLAFEQANAMGGIAGQRLVLVSHDDRGAAQTTRDLATAALGTRPVAIIGTTGTANVKALLPVLADAAVPLLAPVVDAPGVGATRSPYVFHTRPSVTQEAASIIDKLVRMGLRRIALCYEPGGDGLGGHAAAQAALRRQGLQPTAVIDFDGTARHPDAAARLIASADPQAVVFFGQTEAAAAFVRGLRAAGSFAMVVTGSGVDPHVLVGQLPREASTWLAVAQSVPNPSARAGIDPLVRAFADAHMKQMPNIAPTRAGLEGYVAGRVLAAALGRAAERTRGRAPTSTNLLAALEQTSSLDLGGMRVSFDRNEAGSLEQVHIGMVNLVGQTWN